MLDEFGANLLYVGVMEVAEDFQSLLPGSTGGLWVANRAVGVAKVVERFSPSLAVPEFVAQAEGSLIANDSFSVTSEMVE